MKTWSRIYSLVIGICWAPGWLWASEAKFSVSAVETSQHRGWIIKPAIPQSIHKLSLSVGCSGQNQSQDRQVVAVQPITGNKHILLMLDESGSVLRHQRHIKATAFAILDELRTPTLVSVLTFGRSNRFLCHGCTPDLAKRSVATWRMSGTAETCPTHNIMEMAAAEPFITHLAMQSDLQVLVLTDGIEDCTKPSALPALDTLRETYAASIHFVLFGRTDLEKQPWIRLFMQYTGGSIHRASGHRRSYLQKTAKDVIDSIFSRSTYFLKAPASLSQRDVTVGIHTPTSVEYIRSQAPWVPVTTQPRQLPPLTTQWFNWLKQRAKQMSSLTALLSLVLLCLGIQYRKRRRMLLLIEEMEEAENTADPDISELEEYLDNIDMPLAQNTIERPVSSPVLSEIPLPEIGEPPATTTIQSQNQPQSRAAKQIQPALADPKNDPTFVLADPDVKVRLCWHIRDKGGRFDKTLAPGMPLCIGRAADCDISLSDHAVSRQHAKIEVTGQHIVIHPLSQTNPTRVFCTGQLPRRLTEPTTLDIGGVLEIGSTELIFEKRIH